MSINKLILVTVLVRDQDEAEKFYVDKLGFEKKMDIATGVNTRFLTVSPKGQKEISIVLRKPHADDNELITTELDKEIGKGTLWTFSTSNCEEAYRTLSSNGVKFFKKPMKGEYGIEAIFEDLYGNRFRLLEISKE